MLNQCPWILKCAYNCKILCEIKLNVHYIQQVHISDVSNVPDHCCTYALSDTKEECFTATCDHKHDHCCSPCEKLKSSLASTENLISTAKINLHKDEQDDMMFTLQQSIKAINAWKAHQLRSVKQDKARTDIVDQLDEEEVLITQDWAMKFIPQKYREAQSDWYGKRGISWHISVAVRRLPDGRLQHQAFIHIGANCSQEANVVIAIMEHILHELKRETPSILFAFFRQDNAGCYHNGTMLVACHLMEATTSIKIKRVDFSDPQGGKGPCDRKAATVKAHVRRYINEGHDVTTPPQFKDAILSNGGVRGVRVALIDASAVRPVETIPIDGISTLYNFSYSEEGLNVWKAYEVGQGKTLTWSDLGGIIYRYMSFLLF